MNAVDHWSDIAAQVAVAPPQSRAGLGQIDLAYLHIAIYDAVNAIDGRYSVFAVRPATNPLGASMDAATAAAAYTTRGEALFQAGGCEVVAAGEVSHTLQIGDHKSLCVRISPMALGFFDVGYVPVS